MTRSYSPLLFMGDVVEITSVDSEDKGREITEVEYEGACDY